MAFTVKDFPNQTFKTINEWKNAEQRRNNIEKNINERSDKITHVTATVIPASKKLLERTISSLQKQVSNLAFQVKTLISNKEEALSIGKVNKQGLPIGITLYGKSRGRHYTLQVLNQDYLCSDGKIYQSLSGAALGVSDNRRSGWKFWRDDNDNPIGELTKRFKSAGNSNTFRTTTLS